MLEAWQAFKASEAFKALEASDNGHTSLWYSGESICALLKGTQVDMLVADMNQHPDVTVLAMQPLLQFLKPGGAIIMTMKFYGIGRDRLSAQATTAAAFESIVELQNAKVVWLMANTVNERTFIARTVR